MAPDEKSRPTGWWFPARTTAYFLLVAAVLLGLFAYLGLGQIRSANAENSQLRIDRAGRAASALTSARMDLTIVTDPSGSPQAIVYNADEPMHPGQGWNDLVDSIAEVNQGAANVFAYNRDTNAFDRLATTFTTPTGERVGNSQVEPGLIGEGHPAFASLAQGERHIGEVPVAGRLRLASLTPIIDSASELQGALAVDVGWVDDLNRINEQSTEWAIIVTSSLLLALAVIGIIVMYFSFRPLRSLTQAAHALGTANEHPSIGLTHRTDEIGYLASGLAKVADLRQRLEHRAYYDALTDIPNRAALLEELDHRFTLVAGPAANEGFSLLIIDLDGFKEVNDSLGHQAGDELLANASRQLDGCLESGEFLARLGGDEFALITPVGQEGRTQPMKVARRVCAAVTSAHSTSSGEARVSASVGIAHVPKHGTTTAEVLAKADLALYGAKAEGRGSILLYRPELSASFERRLHLTGELRRAIRDCTVDLAYQPIFDARTGSLHSFEALARWNHHDEGPISPVEFIPVAENAGLIGELGVLVLEKACAQMAAWRAAHNAAPMVAVNLSALELNSSGFVENVADALRRHEIPAEQICFELTESVLLTGDASKQLNVVAALRELGVMLSIDDFGTGYSSLSYLHSLDVDQLKIDRTFLAGAVTNTDQAQLLAGIVGLGAKLGLQIVIEGVETVEELALARQHRADLVQGFHLGRPAPASEVVELLVPRCQSDLPVAPIERSPRVTVTR